ncbi:hypothetical protein B0H19DRAFT_1074465 [Mycena capillaripes]|nr:hypothetical protein B0H19DRAFT_1074465 [Mycena capillaripes]
MDVKPELDSFNAENQKPPERDVLLAAYAERGVEIQRLRAKLASLEGQTVKQEVIEITEDEWSSCEIAPAISTVSCQHSMKHEIVEIAEDKARPREAPPKTVGSFRTLHVILYVMIPVPLWVFELQNIGFLRPKFGKFWDKPLAELPGAYKAVVGIIRAARSDGLVSPSTSGGHPRRFMDCVEVPRLGSIYPRGLRYRYRRGSRAPASAALALKLKPRIKKDDAVINLPPDVLANYMGGAQPLEIKPAQRDSGLLACFPRQNLLFNLKKVPALPQRYAGRPVICGTPRINPYLAAYSGDPGLMCSVRQVMVNGVPWSVFLPRTIDGKVLWLYLGEYGFELVGNMTTAQFIDQSDEFQSARAKKLLKTIKFDEYVKMHARIGLRKWGHAITEQNVTREMARIRKHQGLHLNEANVIEALSRGDEVIPIVRMECVFYDHDFLEDIATVHGENA